MDFESLKNQVSNLTLYDIKAGFRKAQNAVMNYTELESKVREATNNEPWGCPTSTMQEIANATFSYTSLNEIMPLIYKRFTEKSAEEWRQIYKALQLLEFLIKNGSERVIDDARSHLSLLKMLKQFHYIDQNGKDQGVNVRNRAKELSELLSDVERIRAERKKARTTRGKYGGLEGGQGIGGGGSGRYGGFGNESEFGGSAQFGSYTGAVYGDGGGFGGNTADDYSTTQGRRERFEEYDEGDASASVASPARTTRSTATSSTSRAKAVPPKPKEPEVDLFDFSAEEPAPAAPSASKQPASSSDDFGAFSTAAADDDFDDFQSATQSSQIAPPTSMSTLSSNTQFAQPKPVGSSVQGMNNIISTISPPPSNTATPSANYSAFKSPAPVQQQSMQSPISGMSSLQPKSTTYQPATPNYFGSISVSSSIPASTQASSVKSPPLGGGKPAAKTSAGGDPFAALALGGASKSSASAPKSASMASMAREKSSAGIWGPSTAQSQNRTHQQQPSGGSGNDLLGL